MVPERESKAEQVLAQAFQKAGWRVRRKPPGGKGLRPDMVVRRRAACYIVELKVGAEGRSDRLIPLWSQAYLQAARLAGEHVPLAVVAAPRIPPRVARNILEFAEQHAPQAAAGVIDLAGLRLFRGPHLESLNASPAPSKPLMPRASRDQADVFSDLNQWMLKVLLAPELPSDVIAAPRGRYRNASQLAQAAGVSMMSAFRFVSQLRHQGYLHESDADLKLVRRDDLFRRWQASALRTVKEVPMRFLLRGSDSGAMMQQVLKDDHACLALFAAADALGFGLVEGVPPYVYVRRLPADLSAWKNMVPAEPGEVPDVIVRQAPSPRSVFSGLVRAHGLPSSDILQVWLDVGGHPSRGQEQAEFIRRRVLEPLMEANHHG